MKLLSGLILEVWVHRCQPVKTGEQNKLPRPGPIPTKRLRADSAKVATTAGRLNPYRSYASDFSGGSLIFLNTRSFMFWGVTIR